MRLYTKSKIGIIIVSVLSMTIAFFIGRIIGEIREPKLIYSPSPSYNPIAVSNSVSRNNMDQLIADLEVYYSSNNDSFIPKSGSIATAFNKSFYAKQNIKIVTSLAHVKNVNNNVIALQYDNINGYVTGPKPTAHVVEAVLFDPKSNDCFMLAIIGKNLTVKTSFRNALYFYESNGQKGSLTATSGIWSAEKKLSLSSSCNFQLSGAKFYS